MTKKLFSTVAVSVALVATPVLAQSDIVQRAAASLEQHEGQADEDDNGPGILLGALAAGLIIAGAAVALGKSDSDDVPTSP